MHSFRHDTISFQISVRIRKQTCMSSCCVKIFKHNHGILSQFLCQFCFILCLHTQFSKLPSLLSFTETSNLQEIWEGIQCRIEEIGANIEQRCTSRAILDSPCPVDSWCRKGPITSKENSDFFFLFFSPMFEITINIFLMAM